MEAACSYCCCSHSGSGAHTVSDPKEIRIWARFFLALAIVFICSGIVLVASAWLVVSSPQAATPPAATTLAPLAVAAPAIAAVPKPKPKAIGVPALSVGYRIKIERAVTSEFGLRAPVAEVAAQLQQESGFNPKAQSPYAMGLAQFIPSTAKWLPTICPHLGDIDPWDADQSIKAAACYDAWLHRNAKNAASACDRLAFMLSDYNGGTGWRIRDQAAAAKAGRDSTVWFDHVETSRTRSAAAHKENRAYVRRILLELTPRYMADGWPGGEACT